jgi:ABC-2 type transport system permease protein
LQTADPSWQVGKSAPITPLRKEAVVVRVHALIVRQTFRRYVTYRGAVIGGITANTVFGVIKAFILTAIWREQPVIGGYDRADVLTYSFLAQAMIGPMALMSVAIDIPARIRSGDIGTDLFRPVDFQSYWLSQDLGRAAFGLLARGVVPFAVGALLFPLRVPADPRVWGAFLVAVFLGVLVSFALRFLVAMAAFWLMDERGAAGIANALGMFFGGMVVPLVMFPGALGDLARALPWASLTQVPADALLRKRSGGSLAGAYLFEAAWAVALLAFGRLVTRRARQRVVAQGG